MKEQVKGWREAELLAQQKEKLAVELQEATKVFCAKASELMDLNRKHFALLHQIYNVDTIFEASLLSPSRVSSSIKWFVIKMGCVWERPVAQPDKIQSILDLIREGNKWASMKYKPKKAEKQHSAEHLL